MTPLDERVLTPSLVPATRPPPARPSPRRLDVLIVLLVTALAFLLASFPARNTDVWLHLAAGRHLVREHSFAPGPGLPDNSSWLYDVLGYGLYETVGGPGLALSKALLVVGLALVLLRLSRAGRGWAVPAACTALAVLAMSTRLLLQPATASCLLLALTFWFLRDPETAPTDRPPALLPRWPLVVLFIVWVNVDRWFVFGLAVVALVRLGEALDEALARGKPGRALLRGASSLAVLAAACLLNPAGPGAFAAAVQSEWPGPLQTAATFGTQQVASPFQEAYIETVGWSPAGLAYYPLLGLGVLSFLLNLPRWHWRRFLPWLALATLSALQVRAIPFFAVAAGPVLAWNLQESLARRLDPRGQAPADDYESPGPRGLAVLLGFVLLLCAWPGWLQAPPFEPRRLAVEPPPSLERGAATTRLWHQEGRLGPQSRGLHLSPEAARVFAWFCPEDNGLLDEGLASAFQGDADAPADWQKQLRAARVSHVILYDPNRARLSATLDGLLADPRQWPLLFLEGDLVVFGSRDPAGAESADPFGGRGPDFNRRAFLPAEKKKAPGGPPETAAAAPWWEVFWKAAPPRPIDRSEAALYLLSAEALRQSALSRHLAAWEGCQTAGLIALAGGGGPRSLIDAPLRLVLARPLQPQRAADLAGVPALDRWSAGRRRKFILRLDDAPPALLYLGVRAARRALAANPHDAQSHLTLGQCYLRLLRATRERAWAERLPELLHLRRAQASAALNEAIALDPGLSQAHLSLSKLYGEMGCLDLALKHLRHYFDLAGKQATPPGADQLAEREAQGREVDRLAREVARREDSYEVAATQKPILERAKVAVRMGLAGKARDMLLNSDISAFGPGGMELELNLLLKTGRPRDVRDWTGAAHKAALGAPSYHWIRAQALAATGEYAPAREECAELGGSLALGDRANGPARLRGLMALQVARAVLDEAPGRGQLLQQLERAMGREEIRGRLQSLAQSLKQEADVTVLRGLLALEQGEADEAEAAFRAALGLWKNQAAAATGAGLEFNGRIIAETCLGWLR